MGIDDLSHTGLVLGLGLSLSSSTRENKITKQPSNLGKIVDQPSLTLSLFGATFDINRDSPSKKVDFDDSKKVINCSNYDMYGQDYSTTSSLISNVSVKREREIGCEEAEIERVSSRVSDEDDDGSNGRKKLRLTKAQSALLEESFKQQSTLNPKQKQDLARELKLRPRQVEVWFQNRRARTKLKQTEVDCELLKKYCDTLSDENRRLQKELNELKSTKPVYMAATLTMCPSCERVAPENAAANKLSRFNMAPKPHFYSPFTNQSAAC